MTVEMILDVAVGECRSMRSRTCKRKLSGSLELAGKTVIECYHGPEFQIRRLV